MTEKLTGLEIWRLAEKNNLLKPINVSRINQHGITTKHETRWRPYYQPDLRTLVDNQVMQVVSNKIPVVAVIFPAHTLIYANGYLDQTSGWIAPESLEAPINDEAQMTLIAASLYNHQTCWSFTLHDRLYQGFTSTCAQDGNFSLAK